MDIFQKLYEIENETGGDVSGIKKLIDSGQLTIGSNISQPDPKESVREIELFNEFNKRNPMAGGGRIGFYKGMSANRAPKKLKLETPKVLEGAERPTKKGTKKYKDIKSIRELDPDYLGKIDIEKVDKKVDNKFVKVYKSGATKYGSVLDDAIEIRNIIVNNKGNIFGFEELGEKAGIYTSGTGSRKSGKGNRPDIRRIRAALILAKDNFPEIANFKFVPERYPGIDGRERQQLNMVVDTIKAYQNSTGDEKLAQFLPDNMGQFYTRVIEKGSKKLPANPEQGLYMKMYNFKPHQIKYISDRITDETGQKFTSKDYNNLVKDVRKFRSQVSTNKRLETRLANMNKVIVDLANDNQIQNLLKGNLNRETQEALLARATQIVGGDASIASRRLFQMAEAMSDTTNAYKNLGIQLNNEKANKIIATGKEIGGRNNRYGMSSVLYDYYGNVVDKAIGSGEGQTFIGKYQQAIRNALDKGQSPDEIFSLTASARTRVPGQGNLAPYALFTQQLRTDVNSAIKGAYIDSALSRTHGKLQEIFKGRKYSQLNASEKEAANLLVEAFEKEKIRALKQPINPGEVKKGAKPIYLTATEKKNMQLPSFDLKNPPSKSIEGFATRFVKYPQIKKAFEKSYKDVGYSMKVTKDMKTQKELLKTLMGDLAGTVNKTCIIRKTKADGGRIGFFSGSPDCDKLSKQLVQKAIKGEGTSQQRSIVNKLIRGGANFLKSAVDPVELLKLRNYVGPQALGFFAAYEAGVIADDVLRMGKPLNEAVASNWLTKSFLPYTEEFAKQENLLKSGTLTGEQRLFALDAMKYNKLLKEVERIEGMEATQLTDQGGMGMIDGTPMVSQAEIDKAMANVTRVAETIDPSVLDPRSAKAIENKAKMDEMEATRMAKKNFSSIFGSPTLKNRAENVDTGDYLPDPLKIDLSPITYKNAEDFKPVTELPANRRIALENLLLPKDQYMPMDRSLSNFVYRDSDKTILEDELEEYNRSQKFKEAFQQPGILGANEKFATGGRAGFKGGTPQSVLRKGVLSLIDEGIKKTPKDTTSALDKLIKKTLDEDLFDKKDRIIDTLNAKIAKERKKFPYNQQVQEEPSQLEFYDDITKSNFRTKTGEYFDRIRRRNKAGGGLLKQAGDRSGPPPESGPNPQGLQGLMKRGMKI